MTGFIGPLAEHDTRCPVCGLDPYDTTCHHPQCPTICDRAGDGHACPQTDDYVADRFAAIYGSCTDLPTPPVPEHWKVSERLAAWDQGRRPADWATRDSEPIRALPDRAPY